MFDYFNVRVYDDEKTDLLKHWDKTFKYITRAKIEGSKVLVHCKMGVSRSASVVIAYAMKAYNWDFDHALKHVKDKRNCIKPNRSFLSQLETYQGMLDAMKNKEKLQRSKSETNLKSPKDARLLPGSEPTPLIQALNVGKVTHCMISGKELRKSVDRPKSWSPDNVESSVLLPKPQSQSLEHIGPPNSAAALSEKESEAAKHIRLPCFNGQNYSVSQNQAVHLQAEEINSLIPSVKLIISELEDHKRMRQTREEDERLNRLNLEQEHPTESSTDVVEDEKNWDPGETDIKQSLDLICDSPVWTSSAQIVHQTPIVNLSISESKPDSSLQIKSENRGDLFSSQLDRVFEHEEKKHVPLPISTTDSGHSIAHSANVTIPSDSYVSRQSSWSSVDSAVVLGFTGESRNAPSRHSSWGSGDTNRQIPSRNSSWGSYDMRNNKNLIRDKLKFNTEEILSMSNSGIFPYDKDEIPWHPGTVKRTKQKIEELSVVKRLCSDANDEYKPDSESTAPVVVNPSHRIKNSRCQSEEILGDRSLSSSYYSRLSASAPETSAMHFIDGSTTVPLRRSQFKTRFSVDETGKSTLEEEEMSTPESGIVRNLKMNFEAKATNKNSGNGGTCTVNATTIPPTQERVEKVRSLPASPVAVHVDLSSSKTQNLFDSMSKDVQNVRGLVDKYEETKMRNNNSSTLPSAARQRPRSVLETKQLSQQSIIASKPLLLTHSKIAPKAIHDETRRPPVPPNVVKTVSGNNNTTTNTIPMTTNVPVTAKSSKKTQQHGKTHPLARLGIPKQRVNTAAYNTM